MRDCPNCRGYTCGREEDGDPCLICHGAGRIEVVRVAVEDLEALPDQGRGATLLTTNNDPRFVVAVRRMKHPDWFRLCFARNKAAWSRRRGEKVEVVKQWAAPPKD